MRAQLKLILFVYLIGSFLEPRALHADVKFNKVPLNQSSQFVAALYRDLLGRAPSATETNALIGLLRTGSTRLQLVDDLIDSVESRSIEINSLFSDLLGRDPQASELSFHLGLLADGESIAVIRATLVASAEYFQSHGGSQRDFEDYVSAFYQDLFGRAPSTNELHASTAALIIGTPRVQVVNLIVSSDEFFGKLIDTHSNSLLGRTFISGQRNFLIGLLKDGLTEEQLRAVLLASDEYFLLQAPDFFRSKNLRLYLGTFSFEDETPTLDNLNAKVRWGDGTASTGELVKVSDTEVAIFGTHTFDLSKKFQIVVRLKEGRKTFTGRVKLRLKALIGSLRPFVGFQGGVRVAVADVNGDGVEDIIAGPGPNTVPNVKVFNGNTGTSLSSFLAYEESFTGGVFVAAGDVNGDGLADIITGSGAGGGPHVKAFSGKDQSLLHSFLAYETSFTGGVTVAAGDVNGDGIADIITGAGPGSDPHVKVFDGTNGSLIKSFLAYDASFAGGVFVAGGDVNGDGLADIITGVGAGVSPHVKAFSGSDNSLLASFFAYGSNFQGGVRVAAADVNGDGKADIITGAGAGGQPHVKVFDGTSFGELKSFFAFGPGFKGGVFVAAGDLDGDGSVSVLAGSGPGTSTKISINR